MKRLHDLVARAGGNLQSLVLLFIRLTWGFQLAESGWGHLTHVDKTAHYFASLHLPFPVANVYLSGSTELLGGVLLMLGLFARPIALPLLVNFAVAYATASRGELVELLHFQNPDDFINDAAFPFLVTSLVILAFGPGKVALDALIFRKSASA